MTCVPGLTRPPTWLNVTGLRKFVSINSSRAASQCGRDYDLGGGEPLRGDVSGVRGSGAGAISAASLLAGSSNIATSTLVEQQKH